MEILMTIITCIAGVILAGLLLRFLVSIILLGITAYATKKVVDEDEDFWKDVK